MAQTAPFRKATTVKKNDRSLLFSINEITHYFKKSTTGSGVFFLFYFLYKNVILQIDPLKSSCSQKQQYPKNFKVKSTPKEQVFGESSCPESHTCKCNCLKRLF